MRKPFMWVKAAAVGAAVAIALILSGQPVAATHLDKVVVCKYVGTPGVDERLQTGQNPIVVSANALDGKGFDGTFPFTFSDAQGQSIAIRWATSQHDGDISECPGYVQPSTEPSGSPEESSTPSSSPTSTPSPSETSVPSPTPSSVVEPTPTPTPTATASPCPNSTSRTSSNCGHRRPSANPTLPPTDTDGQTASDTSDGWTPFLAAVGAVTLLFGVITTLFPSRRHPRDPHDFV